MTRTRYDSIGVRVRVVVQLVWLLMQAVEANEDAEDDDGDGGQDRHYHKDGDSQRQ